ncbi:TolB family protein [Pseudomonas sp.]|uniref:TolB family protein n=1 Tax=Pseudomonas sp. TaxID=306 RepID=UPI003CC66C14
MLNKQILINNLKFLKRSLKESPEAARQLIAHMGLYPSSKLDGAYSYKSKDYRPGETACPTRVVTPPNAHFMTTFFDLDPFSPSGRYLAVTNVPFINRLPVPGDAARVCVIDLVTDTCDVVYETKGWGAQLGANVQWGNDDDTLFCNDVVNGEVKGVRISPRSNKAEFLDGPIFGLTPDKRFSYSPNLQKINALIPGYGVPDPFRNKVREADKMSSVDGIWRTDLVTGETSLFMSLQEIVSQLGDQAELASGTYYAFNTKVNNNGNKLFVILFSKKIPMRGGAAVQLVTIDLSKKMASLAMPDKAWRVGGHHPNWTPDGDNILMNLRYKGGPMAFVKFLSDGTSLEVIAPGHKGSGHPSLDPSGRYLLTDSYISEGFKTSSGDVPLRLIDLESNQETYICNVYTMNILGPRRVDPHPVWSSDGKRIAFNGIVDGYRQVMVVDFEKFYNHA